MAITKIILQQMVTMDQNSITASKYPKYTVVLSNSISSITAADVTSAIESSKASGPAAKQSEINAKQSELNAKDSENEAEISATSSQQSATQSASSATASANSAKAAKTSETNANNSKNAAKTSETNAASSASSASSFATAAENSARAAKTSETNAGNSAQAADASKTAAANSATAAKTSETNAKKSETAAKTSETNAKTSENKAKEYLDMASELVSPVTQYDWPVGTNNNSVYVKIAKLTDPGAVSCHLTLMITNGGNYGSSYGNIDFVEISARGLNDARGVTSENITKFLSVRRLGSPNLAWDNQLRYGLVEGDGYFEVWCYQRAFIKETRVAVLAQTGRTELYIPEGFVSQDTQPSGFIESLAARIYDQVNKPTKADLGLENAMLVGAFGLGGNGLSYSSVQSNVDLINKLKANGGQYWRAARESGANVDINDHGSGFYSHCGDTHAAINVQYNTGIVKVLATTDRNLASDIVYANTLYGTANKPSKSDVGLGNVTNDAQVKKAGDVMSGDLDIRKETPSIRLKSTQGNAHLWFMNNDGGERGVIWSPPNNGSLGEIHIRAKTSDGTSTGDFIVRHDGRIEAKDAKISYKISSRTAEFSNDDTNTAATNLRVSGKQHTPIMLVRDSDSNVSVGFKLNNMNAKLLGIDIDGDLAFGENPDHKQNSKIVTRKMMDAGFSVAGLMDFTNGFAGPWEAKNISDQELDLNSLMIKKSDPGSIRVYQCVSAGGGNNITNKPSGIGGNFILYVESIRKVGDTDFTNRQRLFGTDLNREFTRYCSNGTWSAWRESVVSGMNQDVSVKSMSVSGRLSGNELSVGGAGVLNGNLGVGGGATSKMPSSDKGIVIGRGSIVREGGEGRLILSSSGGTDRLLQLRPAGATSLDNQVEISCTSASAGDTKISFGQGAAIRCNNAGSPIISAKAGQMIYFRPNGDGISEGQMILSPNGDLVVKGGVNSKEIDVTASQSLPLKETTATTGIGVNFIGDSATECSFGIENTAGGSAVFHNYTRGASNSVTKNNQLLGGYGSRPWLGSTYTEHSNAALHFLGAGDTSATNHGGWIRLLVTPKGKTISDRVPAFRLSDNGDLWLVPDGAMHSDLGLVRSIETLNAAVPRFNAPSIQDGRGLKIVAPQAPEIDLIAPRGSGASAPAIRAMWCDGSLADTTRYIGATQPGSTFYIGASGHDGEKFDSMRGSVAIKSAGGWGPTSTPTQVVLETCESGSISRLPRWGVDHNGTLMPMADNRYNLGWGSGRVKQVYAVNGTINTSDARLKNDVRAMSDPETEAAKAIAKEIGFWTWKEQADMNDIREHCGLTVQRAIEIMESFGLDPFKYGFICYDKWDEHTVVSEYGPANEDGTENPIYKTIPAGDHYSFRLEELNLFIAKGFEARLSAIEDKLGM
ncbi:L-shaped tail fiber protein [Escherichia phage T5]|uniref:Side tail fiber protein pb1 n=34 Tax=root TaxID=1 RepID=FIBL1_BPT5|nr:tail fiber protein [Escherichia phage T5]P13390.3 RecName: Full=Side tail fiber protein pb1; Short=STF-pb1; AltName: Full=LTF-pb1; AltName: Full=Tail protein pb1; Contains: RecName: Full=Mature tail spike protein; Contains: RecName: Full=Intramolecular chaperone [Escherichia phage T5]AAQ92751.2 L-shaped tail fiber protein [Escherichia phage T5]